MFFLEFLPLAAWFMMFSCGTRDRAPAFCADREALVYIGQKKDVSAMFLRLQAREG
jgi:hypothetical protein